MWLNEVREEASRHSSSSFVPMTYYLFGYIFQVLPDLPKSHSTLASRLQCNLLGWWFSLFLWFFLNGSLGFYEINLHYELIDELIDELIFPHLIFSEITGNKTHKYYLFSRCSSSYDFNPTLSLVVLEKKNENGTNWQRRAVSFSTSRGLAIMQDQCQIKKIMSWLCTKLSLSCNIGRYTW